MKLEEEKEFISKIENPTLFLIRKKNSSVPQYNILVKFGKPVSHAILVDLFESFLENGMVHEESAKLLKKIFSQKND